MIQSLIVKVSLTKKGHLFSDGLFEIENPGSLFLINFHIWRVDGQ